jgi:hypothetical protein
VAARPRIALGVEPYILRSALYRHLAGTGTFDLRLLGPDEIPDEAIWDGMDAVVVSEAVDLPGARVIVVSPTTETVEVREGQDRTVLPYRGIGWLAALLAGAPVVAG